MNYGSATHFLPAQEMAYTSITNSFTLIGTAFQQPIRVLFVQNLTDAIMDFSISNQLSGAVTHFSLDAGNKLTLDVTTNKTLTAGIYLPKFTGVYVQYRSAPTKGFVQASATY